MPPSSKHPQMKPDVLEFGNDFYNTAYKLEIGMWVVHKAVGVIFSSAEVAVDMESMRHLENATHTVGIYMRPFVRHDMVQTEGPTGRQAKILQWSRLDSPWWRVFRATNIAAEEVNQRGG